MAWSRQIVDQCLMLATGKRAQTIERTNTQSVNDKALCCTSLNYFEFLKSMASKLSILECTPKPSSGV